MYGAYVSKKDYDEAMRQLRNYVDRRMEKRQREEEELNTEMTQEQISSFIDNIIKNRNEKD